MKKKYTLILMLLVMGYSFGQDKWQNMIYDHEYNFNDIQRDFNVYYESVIRAT